MSTVVEPFTPLAKTEDGRLTVATESKAIGHAAISYETEIICGHAWRDITRGADNVNTFICINCGQRKIEQRVCPTE